MAQNNDAKPSVTSEPACPEFHVDDGLPLAQDDGLMPMHEEVAFDAGPEHLRLEKDENGCKVVYPEPCCPEQVEEDGGGKVIYFPSRPPRSYSYEEDDVNYEPHFYPEGLQEDGVLYFPLYPPGSCSRSWGWSDEEDGVYFEPDSEPFYDVDENGGTVLCLPPRPPRSYKRPRPWSDDGNDGASSSDSEPKNKRLNIRSRSPTPSGFPGTSLNPDNNRELPWIGYDFVHLRQRSETVYVDKTGSILQLSDTFRHILLRPPRFGKTTFLSTLEQYYDIKGMERFDEHFESLASDITHIAPRLRAFVALQVRVFILKYARELQIADPDQFVECEIIDMFKNLFDRARAFGYTLFIGVDDYDAPALESTFAHLEWPSIHESFANLQVIIRLLDTYFWEPLLTGMDVIPKLFVTGTSSPTFLGFEHLPRSNLKADPNLQFCCGFTDQEALAFAAAFLDNPPSINYLRRTCGQYIFSSTEASIEQVLHPQELILRIAELSRKPVIPYTPKAFPLLAGIFEHLSNNSDVHGVVTTNTLIDLLASGSVPVDSRAFDGTNVTWSDFHDLGALTFDHQGMLRIANDTILSLVSSASTVGVPPGPWLTNIQIHEHVDTVFADRYDLQHALFYALYPYEVDADPELLLELFSTILCSQMRRAFDNRYCVEPNVHGIFELVMRNTRCAQTSREIDPVVLSPPENTSVVEIRDPDRHTVRRLALKTLTLRGLWRGANPNDDQPSIEALRELHARLVQEDEECLMVRPYCALDTGDTALVQSFLEVEQGFVLLAVGGARVLMRSVK
ncbi:hypothetical protein DFH06DRAFT_1429911 [Mycena polygramma]|nr:hypothetical protein DFH06DRAFT_1429911 [Mycena polygramma]